MREDDASDEMRAGDADTGTLAFDVATEDAGQRLDAYLATRIEGWSRARLQRLIDEGEVVVDGETRKPSYKLRASETVEVELAAAPAALHLTPENIPLDIIYEDADIIVVNKPAGMVVHPAAGVRSGTLANALAFRLRMADSGSRIEDQDASRDEADDATSPAMNHRHATINQPSAIDNQKSDADNQAPETGHPQSAIRNPQSAVRPGIVHRLDRDTSGLIVVAKNESAHEHLAEQFRAREVFKSYVALVHGIVGREAQATHRAGQPIGVGGRIDQPIGRNVRQRTEMAVVRGGRSALTLYRVRRWFDRFTLLDVEIKTGRTHQIRVHMAWLKHPVVGDGVYGAGRDGNVPDRRLRTLIATLDRQFLHAEQLGFRHPRTGESMRFVAPLAPELQAFLDGLESLAGGGETGVK